MHTNIIMQEELHFSGENQEGKRIEMDAHVENAQGPSPKELVLMGLSGCTGMDVISILKKMRVPPKNFRIEADTTLNEDHPRVFQAIHLKFFVSDDVPDDKLNRAIELSQNQYCGVAAMLKKNSEITWEVIREN